MEPDESDFLAGEPLGRRRPSRAWAIVAAIAIAALVLGAMAPLLGILLSSGGDHDDGLGPPPTAATPPPAAGGGQR